MTRRSARRAERGRDAGGRGKKANVAEKEAAKELTVDDPSLGRQYLHRADVDVDTTAAHFRGL